MVNPCDEIRFLLNEACKAVPNESILLSGGLDSSILLLYIKPRNAITISISGMSSDYIYASKITKKIETSHKIIHPEDNIVLECLDELVSDYKTFDPIFLRNMAVQLIGFKKLSEMNFRSVVTGDGADELFAGYNFLHKYNKEPILLESKLQALIQNMNFDWMTLAKKYGLDIYCPFLDKDIINFARSLSVRVKIRENNGTLFGKYFLRECFEDVLGKDIVWRKKEAMESGSGMSQFMNRFIMKISDEDYINGYRAAKMDNVTIRDKEHLYYYQIYRKYFPAPIDDPANQIQTYKICSYCKSKLGYHGSFCKVCGAYPI